MKTCGSRRCFAASIYSVQFSSVAQSCLTLCNPIITSMMPSNHLILCHPFLHPPSIFPSIRVFSNESVLRIRWKSIGVSSSASVLPVNIQDWLPLGWTGWISLQSKGLWRVFSNTTVQKHQFFSPQLSLWSNYHIHRWLLENHREMGESNCIEMGKCLAFDKNIP